MAKYAFSGDTAVCTAGVNVKLGGFQSQLQASYVSRHTEELLQLNRLSVDDNIYAPPRGLRTLAKEFTAATRIMQSSLNDLSTLVSGKAKM